MPLYNNILSSKKVDKKDESAQKNNPNASLRMLQEHLMSKRRIQQQNPNPRILKQSEISHSEQVKSNQIISERVLHKSLGEDPWDLEEEYDPRVPNSYEVLQAELIKAAEEQKLAMRNRSTSQKIDLNLLSAIDKLEDEELHLDDKKGRGTAIAPPPSLVQGSTKVVLLQNMVGPGEVDDNLEAETKEECKKYGEVVKCLIYEIPNNLVPDDEAVRIFVEFRKVESAIKATSDLNGRYFGGRVVKASFYNMDRFHKYELGPTAK